MHDIYVIAIVCAQKSQQKMKVDFFARFIFPFCQKIFSIFIAYIYELT